MEFEIVDYQLNQLAESGKKRRVFNEFTACTTA
jgi:hypothetical protein